MERRVDARLDPFGIVTRAKRIAPTTRAPSRASDRIPQMAVTITR
jgi:hypothetical protein